MILRLENNPIFYLVMEGENVVMATQNLAEAEIVASFDQYRTILRCLAELA